MQTNKFPFCKSLLTVALITIINTNPAMGQTGIDTGLANTLQTSINNLRSIYNVKGISAAAYMPGKGLWKGVTGVSYGSVPIDTNMLLCMGSITKTFVAAETFKLIEAGLLSLTDTVGALLPPLANVNPGITVKQLLGHTSGMGDYNSSWIPTMFADPTAMWYYTDALNAFCDTAVGPPGSPWQYCNTNYSLLGMIIEAKKSDSLHKVLRTDLLLPSHLGNTYMEALETYSNAIAHNWITPTLDPTLAVDSSSTPHQALWSSVEPQGGYFSDAGDLAKWGYDLYSGKVLSASSLSDMLTFTPVSAGYFNGYGLGAMRFLSGGRTYYGHGGNYYGYAASMLYYPEDSICVSVLINQDCIATYEARTLMNTLITKLATGIIERSSDRKIRVSPNPANTELIIEIPGNTTATDISVTDITGKEVYRTGTSSNTLTLKTINFSNGTYIIRINSNGQTTTKHFVVAH